MLITAIHVGEADFRMDFVKGGCGWMPAQVGVELVDFGQDIERLVGDGFASGIFVPRRCCGVIINVVQGASAGGREYAAGSAAECLSCGGVAGSRVVVRAGEANGHVNGYDVVRTQTGCKLIQGRVNVCADAGIRILGKDEPASWAAINAVEGGGGRHGL